jgi:hypothetical protein
MPAKVCHRVPPRLRWAGFTGSADSSQQRFEERLVVAIFLHGERTFHDANLVERVEAFGERRRNPDFRRRFDPDIRYPSASAALSVASQRVCDGRLEAIADDARGVSPRLFDQGDAVLAANVGVVHDHRTAARERFSNEELLPPLGIGVTAEVVLADDDVCSDEPLVAERGLTRSLQSNEDHELEWRTIRRRKTCHATTLARRHGGEIRRPLLA